MNCYDKSFLIVINIKHLIIGEKRFIIRLGNVITITNYHGGGREMVFCCPNCGEERNTEDLVKCASCQRFCAEPLVMLQVEFSRKYKIPVWGEEID